MSAPARAAALALLLAPAAAPALAQPAAPAVGADVYASSDADHTDIARYGLNLDFSYAGPDRRQGLRLEDVRIRPSGQAASEQLRVYWRFADTAKDWTWNGQAGTDGRSLIGAFDIHDAAPFRQEYFLERGLVETQAGLKRGLYYTFAGGAVDLPVDKANSFNLVGAVQDFTGDNTRFHLRSTYVYALEPEWGLTAQVRARAFYSTRPGEFDYFSPRLYAQVLPVLQLRRFQAGWRYLLAAGAGTQWQTGTGWRPARMLNAQVTSPATRGGWALTGAFTYTNTPTGAGYTYDYREASLGLTRAF